MTSIIQPTTRSTIESSEKVEREALKLLRKLKQTYNGRSKIPWESLEIQLTLQNIKDEFNTGEIIFLKEHVDFLVINNNLSYDNESKLYCFIASDIPVVEEEAQQLLETIMDVSCWEDFVLEDIIEEICEDTDIDDLTSRDEFIYLLDNWSLEYNSDTKLYSISNSDLVMKNKRNDVDNIIDQNY